MKMTSSPGRIGIEDNIVLSVSTKHIADALGYHYEFQRLPDLMVPVVRRSTARIVPFYLRLDTAKFTKGLDQKAAVNLLVAQFDDLLAMNSEVQGNPGDLQRMYTTGDSSLQSALLKLLWPVTNRYGRAELTGAHTLRNYPANMELIHGSKDHTLILDLPRNTRFLVDDYGDQRRFADGEVVGQVTLFGKRRKFTLNTMVSGETMNELFTASDLSPTKILWEIEQFVGSCWPFIIDHKLMTDLVWGMDEPAPE